MKLNFKPHRQSGILITFCGLDGSGKTTLINMLDKKLSESGFNIHITKQPTETIRKSEIFRTYIKKQGIKFAITLGYKFASNSS